MLLPAVLLALCADPQQEQNALPRVQVSGPQEQSALPRVQVSGPQEQNALPRVQVSGPQEQNALPRVLFLTHSAGFVHSVVQRGPNGELAHAERELVSAAQGRFDVTCTQDCALLGVQSLAGYDALVFYTTGELPIPPEDRVALIDWVRDGGAFVGVHCATDTFYEFRPYQDMLGGVFDGHPWHEEVGIAVEDTAHPATRHLGERFRITDEIYQFRDFARYPLHVLMRLDGDVVDLSRGKRPDGDYPNAWCKAFGRGAVFYTALGHREDVWTDPRFREHLLAGISWALEAPLPSQPPPAAASVLFSGQDLSAWRSQPDRDPLWRVDQGELVVVPGTGDLVTSGGISGDFLLHLEFLLPPPVPGEAGEARANSGLYLQGRYEVQLLDSLGRPPGDGECGAVYGQHAPPVDACRSAGEWQSLDVLFRSPSHDDATGAKTADARLTVWLNGERLHDEVALTGPTAGALAEDEPGVGPLRLQDHGAPVRFRNIWFLPR